MEYRIRPMKLEEAMEISHWQYDEPYELYSMDGSAECLNELMNGAYYSAFDDAGRLSGYFCYGVPATVPAGRPHGVYDEPWMTDIGLGMAPELCGKGLGQDFMKAGMEFARRHLSAQSFRLTVVVLNERAIKVYESLGFERIGSFWRRTGDEAMDLAFHVMILK